MNILYLSCHGTLEYDEVKLLTELGHDVFCIGDYGGNERPLIRGRDRKCNWLNQSEIEQCLKFGQANLPEFAIDRCDVIISMHVSEWLMKQWGKIKKKKCYLRLIGQHYDGLGERMRPYTDEGLKIIPYWPSDLVFNKLKEDQVTKVVRFYKDENEFTGWVGNRNIILTVCNDIMRGGGKACRAEEYRSATNGLPRLLVGKNNRLFGDFTGRVPYWLLKDFYRECKLYFYIGTNPATYTLNLIEAMMTGMPIVAFDNKRGISEIINCVSNDAEEVYEILKDAIEEDLSKLLKYQNRNRAIELFGKTQALINWKDIL